MKDRPMGHPPYSRSELLAALQGEDLGGVPASFYELNPYYEESWYYQDPAYAGLVQFAKERADTFGFAGVGMGMFVGDDTVLDHEVREERLEASTLTTRVLHTPKGDLVARGRKDEGVHTSWELEYFLKTEEDVERFLSLPYQPPKLDFSRYENVERQLGEKGVPVVGVADPICRVMDLAGFMQVALWCRTEPELVIKLGELMSERLATALAEIAARVRRTAFRITGPEYSAPPLLSVDWFDKVVAPHDKRLVEIIRESDPSNIAILHCHGRLDAVLERILAIGPHVLEPLEPPPLGDVPMKELRRRAGDNLVLMGYMQFRELESDTEEETERKVRLAIEEGYRNGGLLLIPTAFPIVTPLPPGLERNLIRFVTTAKEMVL